MAKRFTVQKRLLMRSHGYETAGKQWAWDASEYVGAPKKFTPAKAARPAPERKTVTVSLTSQGKGPSRCPIWHCTDWTPETRLIKAR